MDERVEYEYLHPAEFDARVAAAPVAYQPIGAMEWHAKHLPFGLDGLKALEVCRLAARRFGGVVMPPFHLGIHPPFRMKPFHRNHNLYVGEAAFKQLMTEICDELEAAGFRVIVLFTGHHPRVQGKFLEELAQERIYRRHGRVEILVPDEAAVAEAVGSRIDHAGTWETSLAMALFPELVHLDRLDDLAGITAGDDPRQTASRELGERGVEELLKRLGEQVAEALAETRGRP